MQNKLTNLISGFFKPILQVIKSVLLKHYPVILLFIIPMIFLINTSVIHYYQSPFFQGSVDPEYFHLYNGIVIGGGNLDVEYIAHPATPLQFLIAFSARTIHLFQPDDYYVRDFIDDPEKYIHAANLLMNIIIALILLVCGIYTIKYSGYLILGLIIQLAPFGNSSILGISGRLLPESMMIIPLLLLGLLIIRYIFKDNNPGRNNTNIVLFSMSIGFGIACKLSFIPVIMLPLILLKVSLKYKIRYLLYTIMFFLIFAYPVIFNFNVFREWVTGIFTHSGMHGAGEKNFIDLSTVPGNFKYLFSYDKLFFYLMIISLLLSLIFSFRPFKNPNHPNSKIIRAIVAVNITIILSIAFILKHFVFHYFMPFYILKYLLIILSTLLILRTSRQLTFRKFKGLVLALVLILTFIITYSQALKVSGSLEKASLRKASLQQSYDKIIPLINKDKPIIITGPYYGTPLIEFAQNNGFMMTYNRKGYFKQILKEKYPNSYIYVSWSDKFYYWDDFVDFKQILDKTKNSFYIYIGREKGKDLIEIEKRIWQVIDKDSVTIKTLYEDKETEEQLIEIDIDDNSRNEATVH